MKKNRLYYCLLALGYLVALPAVAQNLTQPTSTATPPAVDNNDNVSKVRIDNFVVKGNTLLNPALIVSLLEPFKGDDRTYTDIQLALEALEGAYRNAGYSAVHVVTPEQEITNGTITFQVLETVIGKVILKASIWAGESPCFSARSATIFLKPSSLKILNSMTIKSSSFMVPSELKRFFHNT